MTSFYRAALRLCILFAGCHAAASAAPFDKAPTHLKAYFEKAKAADQIVDPMQRCLAYPDYPGNHWPAGAAAAQCEVTFRRDIKHETITRLIDEGKAAELDALFMRDLNRHFSKTDFSEMIHADLKQSLSAENPNELTQLWIELAPESPFANLARGRYLAQQGFEARGGAWAADTPVENMRRMSDFMEMAIKFYDKAIRLEPRLLPAYSGLIDVARADSHPAIGESAFARAQAIDPGCRDVAWSRMDQLEPRWGGSYEAMDAYAAQLARLVPKRPLMAGVIAEPALDRAAVANADGNAPRAIELLRAATDKTPARIPMYRMAEYMTSAKIETWETLARLTAADRFQGRDRWEAATRAMLLIDLAGDKKWAFRQLARSVRTWDDAFMLTLFQRAASDDDERDAVEAVLVKKASDLETGVYARFALFRHAFTRKQAAKADRYVAVMLEGFLSSSEMFLTQAYTAMRRGDEKYATDAFKRFVANTKELQEDLPEEVALAERYIAGERDPLLTGKQK